MRKKKAAENPTKTAAELEYQEGYSAGENTVIPSYELYTNEFSKEFRRGYLDAKQSKIQQKIDSDNNKIDNNKNNVIVIKNKKSKKL